MESTSTKATQQLPPIAGAHQAQALLHSKSKKADDSFVVTKSPFNSTASLSKRSSETPATKRSGQEPLLHPQHPRSDEPVPEHVAVDVVEPDLNTLSRSTTQNNNKKGDTDDHGAPDDEITKEKERQERYTKYSQKALGFAIYTFTTYAIRSISASSTGDIVFFVATAAFFIAISADLFSWKMKPKQGDVLAYISSFSLVMMTLLIFVSLNKDYGYTLLALPLMISAAFLQHKVLPEVGKERSESTNGDKDGENLDEIFDFSALILNWGGLISAIIAIVKSFVVSGPDKLKLVTVCAIGFLFFFTVLLGIYLMLVTTVRTAILTLHARYLYVLLRVVLVGTLIATLITCIRA